MFMKTKGQAICRKGADWSRTCEGCLHMEKEPEVRGKAVYRCFAEGPNKGYDVGWGQILPYVPAWCPVMNQEAGR